MRTHHGGVAPLGRRSRPASAIAPCALRERLHTPSRCLRSYRALARHLPSCVSTPLPDSSQPATVIGKAREVEEGLIELGAVEEFRATTMTRDLPACHELAKGSLRKPAVLDCL